MCVEQSAVLVVSEYTPGISTFLSSINQEVVVLFDEFEKTFIVNHDNDTQAELLPLFDGVDCGKKLFVITCNETSDLNSYLLNRPGHFHYHFILTSPSSDEVREYMNDKLNSEGLKYMEQIVRMSLMNQFTYDCLRAIAFDLNIHESRNKFLLTVTFEDGKKYSSLQYINLHEKDNLYFELSIDKRIDAEFTMDYKYMKYDNERDMFVIKGENVEATYESYDDNADDAYLESIKKRNIVEVTIQRDMVTTKLFV